MRPFILAATYTLLATWPAQDQVISACVNNNSGTIHVGVPCQSNEAALSWNVQGPPGPPGPPGESGAAIWIGQFNCLPGQTIPFGGLVTLVNPIVGGQLTSVVLQPGTYLVHFAFYGTNSDSQYPMLVKGWSTINGPGPIDVELYINGQLSTAPWLLSGQLPSVPGSQPPWALNGGLLEVNQANTTLSLYNAGGLAVQTGSCYLSIIQLQ